MNITLQNPIWSSGDSPFPDSGIELQHTSGPESEISVSDMLWKLKRPSPWLTRVYKVSRCPSEMDFIPLRDSLDPVFFQFLHISVELREKREWKDGGLGAGHTGALRDLSTYTKKGVKVMRKGVYVTFSTTKLRLSRIVMEKSRIFSAFLGFKKGVFQN